MKVGLNFIEAERTKVSSILVSLSIIAMFFNIILGNVLLFLSLVISIFNYRKGEISVTKIFLYSIPILISIYGFFIDMIFYDIIDAYYIIKNSTLLIFLFTLKMIDNYVSIKKWSIILSLVLLIWVVGYNVYFFFFELDSSEYMWNFSRAIFLRGLGNEVHASYFSLYLNLIYTLIMFRWNRYYSILKLLIFITVFFLASKINILILFFLVSYEFFKLGKKYFIALLLIVGVIFTVLYIETSGQTYSPIGKFKRTYDVLVNKNVHVNETTTIRINIWSNSVRLFSENPLIGYGSQNGRKLIKESFINDGRSYNCHNQFLQYSLTGGILALILSIIFFTYPLFVGYLMRDVILIISTSVIILNLLVENMLDRHWGVVLISFFYILFLEKSLDQEKSRN